MPKITQPGRRTAEIQAWPCVSGIFPLHYQFTEASIIFSSSPNLTGPSRSSAILPPSGSTFSELLGPLSSLPLSVSCYVTLICVCVASDLIVSLLKSGIRHLTISISAAISSVVSGSRNFMLNRNLTLDHSVFSHLRQIYLVLEAKIHKEREISKHEEHVHHPIMHMTET